MANPLYPGNKHPLDNGGLFAFAKQVQEMERNFRGNPRAEVEKLLASGQMSQADFNRLAQIANNIFPLMNRKR